MKLFCTPNSTFARRVRIALHEKQLEAEEIDTPAERRGDAEFLALNPYGRIPVFVDGELVLYESTAILEHLETIVPEPALLPGDVNERALCRQWCKLCDLEYSSRAVRIQRPKRGQPESEWPTEDFAAQRPGIAEHYAALAVQLERSRERHGESTHLVSAEFSLADLCYLPFLHFADLLDVEMPASVEAWTRRVLERASAKATIPTQ